MEKAAILVICSHPEILQTIIRLIDANPEWNAAGAISEAEAIGLCQTRRFDLALLGSGMDNTSASRLKAAYPDIKLIQHYGGGSGLLSAEIYGALGG
jgi:hypothetical protein